MYFVRDTKKKILGQGEICLDVGIVGFVVAWQVRRGPAFNLGWRECLEDPVHLGLPQWHRGGDGIRVRGSSVLTPRGHDDLANATQPPSQSLFGCPEDRLLAVAASWH